MLIVSEDISAETRETLLEHRLEDAAKRLMQEYGLSCVKAGDLLKIAVCKDVMLVLVSSLVTGCGCLAAQSYENPACEKYHTDWPTGDFGED